VNTSHFKITKFDYEFLTGNWEGPKGAAYNAVAEDCKDAGFYNGWTCEGLPALTKKGMKALEEYRE
jgi:hypothetical protein